MTASIQLNLDDEWETPTELFQTSIQKYNVKPELDVCATESNNKCMNFFSKDQNGLNQKWDRNFFMNPPYSKVDEWVCKAYTEHHKHNVTGIALIFSKTDTKWWHEYIEGKAEVHFIKGRIKFYKDGMPSKHPAPYPSCFVVWRKS